TQFSRSNEHQNERRDMDRELMQLGNLRAALVWAFSETGEGELGVRLAALAAPHLVELSLLEECHRWCQAALSQLGSQQGSATHLILQEALAISALFTRASTDEVRNSVELAL